MPSSILNSDDGVISGTAGLKNSGGDDAVLLIQTNGTTAQTVDAGQRTMFPTTIGVGGATPSTSGSGISFPATQSASTNANTLDDYEEGTWTPSVGGNATYTNQDGKYTKIGNMVYFSGHLNINTIGTGSANEVSGLPFTSTSAVTGIAVISWFNLLAANVITPTLEVNSSATTMNVYSRNTSGSTAEQPNVFGNSARIFFTGMYRV